MDLGYLDITVLDISAAAIERVKLRLGVKAEKVKWIVADAAHFIPNEKYDFWHDRAAFHFLTDEKDVKNYIETAHQNINRSGVMVVGTFSEQGPKKCSGIDIQQYSVSSLTGVFSRFFKKLDCITIDHQTPFDTIQNFVFCSFNRLE